MLQFEQPLMFFLLIPLVWFVFLYCRKKGSNKKDRYLIGSLRGLSYSLLIFALAIPTLVLPSGNKQVVFLVDRSVSVEDQFDTALNWIYESIESKHEQDEFAIVTFAENGVLNQNFKTHSDIAAINEMDKKGHTNLENGLLTASRLFTGGSGRIVLFSDGNETIGQVNQILPQLKDRGIEVDIVPLTTVEKEDTALTDLSVSETMYEGELANVEVRITSNVEKVIDIRISVNDRDIIVEKILVKQGDNVFHFNHLVQGTGLSVYKAEIAAPNDYYVENNSLYAVSNIQGIPKVLLVQEEESQIATILENANLEVDIITPIELPSTLGNYLKYSTIIFNNISGTKVTELQMNLIQQSVHDFGNGFIMLGGENSFGLGGYFKTPIEEILPVEMEIKSKEELPSLGLIIVMDRSGSMMGNKLTMAKEAAARSVELLREEDTLGFIAFDSQPWVIVETGPIDNKEETIEKIRSVTAGGGTEIYSSLALAYEELQDLNLQRKHIILLTDGDSATSGDYYALIEEGKEHNVTLSTVALGMDANRVLLESLAEEGGGRFYDVTDDSTIPSILSRETVMITRTYIENDPFYPTVYGIDGWNALFQDGVPEMNAYIATTPKQTAKLPIISAKEDPVLAEWQYGLGTTIAYTSAISPNWGGDFSIWSGFPSFINYMVSRTLPKYGTQPMSLELVNEGENSSVILKGNNQQLYKLDASIVSQDGNSIETNTKILAPGEYKVELPNQAGLYFINAVQTLESGQINTFQTGFSIPFSKEYIQSDPNLDLLATIAEATGGIILEDEADSFRKLTNPSLKRMEISQWILIIAFLILFIEFAIRRLGVHFFINKIRQLFKRERKQIQRTTMNTLLEKQKDKRLKKLSNKTEQTLQSLNTIEKERVAEKLTNVTVEKTIAKKDKAKQSSPPKEQKTETVDREERMKRLLEARKRKR